MENRRANDGDRRAAGRQFRPRDLFHAKFLGEGLLWIAAGFTLVTGYNYLHAGIVHVNVEETRRAETRRQAQAIQAGTMKAAKPSQAT